MEYPIIKLQTEFIKGQFCKGALRAAIEAAFKEQWPQVSERTFSRRLAHAKAQLPEGLPAIRPRAEEAVLHETEIGRTNIMSVIERRQILSQIARGEIAIQKKTMLKGKSQVTEITPDFTDRRNAIIELNKMDGAYQPLKTSLDDNREIIFDIG